jgi:hypothetical protein
MPLSQTKIGAIVLDTFQILPENWSPADVVNGAATTPAMQPVAQ